LMTYPGGKHGLVRMPQQGRHYYEMVVRFFEKELAAESSVPSDSTSSGSP
jgi:dipeptidyl-peptidase 4